MILYQLQPFVRLFQACGIIPFSVHVDVETSSLKEFTFSLRHPVFWWFAIAIVWHIACPLIPILFVNLYVKEKLNRYDETPIAVIVFMAMSVIIWCKDELNITTFNSKATLGAAIVVALSIVGTVASYPAYPLIVELFGSNLANVIVFCYFTLLLSNGFFFLFFHTMYCMIGLYIKQIRLCLRKSSVNSNLQRIFILPDRKKFTVPSKIYNDKVLGGPIMSIQEGQTCFNYVCNAASELNAAFSFTAFVILTTEFVSAVINLYTLTASIMQPSDLMQRRQPKFIFNFMIGVLIIIVVSYTAEIPVREASKLRECVINMQTEPEPVEMRSFMQSKCETRFDYIFEITSFIIQIRDDRLRLTAMGLFDVGTHLLPNLSGAVVTYLVILFQQLR